jgi:hypothetical protein
MTHYDKLFLAGAVAGDDTLKGHPYPDMRRVHDARYRADQDSFNARWAARKRKPAKKSSKRS